LHFPPFNSDTLTRNQFNEVEKFFIFCPDWGVAKNKGRTGDAKIWNRIQSFLNWPFWDSVRISVGHFTPSTLRSAATEDGGAPFSKFAAGRGLPALPKFEIRTPPILAVK
jgi:hypothetical protein